MKAIVSASAEATPQFYDLDPMNIVWRMAVMNKIGYGYQEMVASGFAWPIIDLRMRYARSMRLERPVRISAGIVEWENTLRIVYQIADVQTGERIMRASSSQVAISIANNEMLWVAPAILQEKLAPFLSSRT
jgi:acyl-CoA thioester hydrolase